MEFHRDGAADIFKGYTDIAFFTASEQVCRSILQPSSRKNRTQRTTTDATQGFFLTQRETAFLHLSPTFWLLSPSEPPPSSRVVLLAQIAFATKPKGSILCMFYSPTLSAV